MNRSGWFYAFFVMFVLGSWGLLVQGCSPDLAVSKNTTITCSDDSECPDGYMCKDTIGLCVKMGAGDDVAPEIVQKLVSPQIAGKNTAVRVEFTTNEELIKDPEVVFAIEPPVRLGQISKEYVEDGNGIRYVYEGVVKEGFPEGNLDVEARHLIDMWGNENAAAVLGTISIDYTPPQPPDVEVIGATADLRVNTTAITLEIRNYSEANEVLIAGAGVDGTNEWLPVAEQMNINLKGGEDGIRPVKIRFRDAAGNESDDTDLSLFLDTSAPELIDLNIGISGGFQAAKEETPLEINGITELGALVESWRIKFLSNGSEIGTQEIGSGISVEDGRFTSDTTLRDIPTGTDSVCVEFVLSDGLNQSDWLGCNMVQIPVDTQPPQNASLSIQEQSPTNGHDVSRPWVSLILGVENTGRTGMDDIEVYISGEGVSNRDEHKDKWIPYPQEGRVEVFLAEGDGQKNITAKYRDGAGNETASVATATIELDTIPPENFDITGPTLISRQSLQVVLTGTGASEVFISGDVQDGEYTNQWIPWQSSVDITLSGYQPGTYTIWAKARDAAGNETDKKTLVVEISENAIAWTEPEISAPNGQIAIKTGDSVVLGGTACNGCTLSSASLVFLSSEGNEIARNDITAMVEGTWGQEDVTISGTVPVMTVPENSASIMVEIIAELTGELSDPANSRSNTIEIDNVPPENGSVSAQSHYTNTSTLQLNFAVENPGRDDLSDIEMMVGGDMVSSSSGTEGRPVSELPKGQWVPFAQEASVLLVDEERTGTITVSFRDGAHNEVQGDSFVITYDTTPPSNISITTQPSGKTGTTSIQLNLSANEAATMNISGDISNDWAGDWMPYETSKDVVLTDGDGVKNIMVRFRDEAGNESEATSTSVELDTEAPSGSISTQLDEARTAIGIGTIVAISGNASADASINSCSIRFFDSSDSEIQSQPASQITLSGGVFAGTATATQIPSDAVGAKIVCELTDGANTGMAESNTIPVDIVPPEGLTLSFVAGNYVNTNMAAATLGITNQGHTGFDDLEMYFDGSGLSDNDAYKGKWSPYSGNVTLLLSDGDGQKIVTVKVRDGAHNETEQATAIITLDTTPPSDPSIVIQGPSETANPIITVSLSCSGATKVMVYGDIIQQSGVSFEWIDIPQNGELMLQLTSDAGTKVVMAKFKDDAGNESEVASDSILFTSDKPQSSPTLTPPDGQSRVKFGDTLSIGGQATADSEITSAALVFFDSDQSEVGRLPLSVPDDVILNSTTGEISGSITLNEQDVPANAEYVKIEVLIRRSGGTCPEDCSEADSSRSPIFVRIDKLAPSNPSLSIWPGTNVNTRQLQAIFGVENPGESGMDDIELKLSGNGVDPSTMNYNTWIPYENFMDIMLTEGEGNKVVQVVYRDGAHHVTSPVQITVNYDTTAPSNTGVTIESGAEKTNSRNISVSIGAIGADYMFISGDIEGPSDVIGKWIDFTTHVDLQLLSGDGIKSVVVNFKDEAGNQGESATDTIYLDTVAPEVSLSIAVQGGLSAATGNSVLDVSGQTEVGATIVQTRVLDGDGNEIPSAAANVEISQGGIISGTITLPSAAQLSGIDEVMLEVRVSDGVNTSAAADSRSNTVPIDTTPPSVSANFDSDYTNSTSVTLHITASSDAVETRISGDVSSGMYSSWSGISNSVNVILSSTDGPKTVVVEVRDSAHNVASTSVSITLDTEAPESSPILILPDGQTRIKNNDTLTISGSAYGDPIAIDHAYIIDDGGTMLKDITSSVSMDAGGHFSGSIDVGTMQEGKLIGVEIVVRDHVNNSEPGQSRTAFYLVDNTAPANGSVEIAGGASVVGSENTTLAISATGASEMYIYGDVEDTSTTNEWIAYNTQASIILTDGDGEKTVNVRFRDEAHNEYGPVSDTITLNTTDLTSSPRLTPPSGQTLVKEGDSVIVEGSSEAGASIVSATLLDENNDSITDVTSDVSIDPDGFFHGNITLSGITPFQSIRLQIIVSARGKQSSPENSRSPALNIDNDLPQITSFVATPAVTNTNSITLTIVASDSTSAMQMYLDGDITGSNARTWMTYSGTVSVSLDTSNEGGKAITVRIRDGAFNETQSQTWVNYDITAPWASPELELPTRDGVTQQKVKHNDMLTITGVVENGSTLVSSHVIDQNGDLVLDVTSDTSINSDGTLSGSFDIGTIPYGTDFIKLEVIVADAAGNTSSASESRSSEKLVDVTAPPAPTVIINNDDTYCRNNYVSVRFGNVSEDIVWFKILPNGSVQSSAYNHITSIEETISVYLTPSDADDGEERTVAVEFLDGAMNKVQASDSIILDQVPPWSRPRILPPAGQIRVKSNDLLTIEGSASPKSTIVEISVLDENLDPLPKGTSNVILNYTNGTFGGTYQLASLESANEVMLGIIVEDDAGNRSYSYRSISNSLEIDNMAPTTCEFTIQEPSYINYKHATIKITYSGDVREIYIGGTGVANTDITNQWIATNEIVTVDLSDGDGNKTITLRCRDGAYNERDGGSDSVYYDGTPPSVSLVRIDGKVSIDDRDFIDEQTQTLTIAATDNESGLDSMFIGGTLIDGDGWNPYATHAAVRFTSGEGMKNVYVLARDKAGNVAEEPATDTAFLDITSPTRPRVSSFGYVYTNESNIMLTLDEPSTDQDFSTYQKCIANSSACSCTWQDTSETSAFAYSTTTDGTYYLCIRGKDVFGNTSPSDYVRIIRDATPPTQPRWAIIEDNRRCVQYDAMLRVPTTDANFDHYEIIGGYANEYWTEASTDITQRVFHFDAIPQNSVTNLGIRAVDKAGNVSEPDFLILHENSLVPILTANVEDKYNYAIDPTSGYLAFIDKQGDLTIGESYSLKIYNLKSRKIVKSWNISKEIKYVTIMNRAVIFYCSDATECTDVFSSNVTHAGLVVCNNSGSSANTWSCRNVFSTAAQDMYPALSPYDASTPTSGKRLSFIRKEGSNYSIMTCNLQADYTCTSSADDMRNVTSTT